MQNIIDKNKDSIKVVFLVDIVLSLIGAVWIFLFAKVWQKENFVYFKTYSLMVILAGILGYINSFKVL